jgi:predicted TIM-barrel fold metal-dependent hydrolase
MNNVIIDSDGHVNERDDVLVDYLPEPFRGRRELLGRPFFPPTDHFHRMAEGILDAREREAPAERDTYGGPRASLGHWQSLLDESGIKWAALYPSRGLAINNWHSPEWGAALATGYNDWLHQNFTSDEPRLKGVALLHLYDVDTAIAEMRRAVLDLGFEGAVLMSSGLPQPLGNEMYFPLYQEAERLDVPLAVHAGSSDALAIQDGVRALWEVRAMSHGAGQITSFLSMINGGVFDAFPRLRVAFLESGCGWIPYLVDRMDRVYHGRGARLSQRLHRSPTEHLADGRIFVHAELDEWMLPTVADIAGRDDIFMYASDFPHERWDAMVVELDRFCEREDLGVGLIRGTLGLAAQRFYGLNENGARVDGPRLASSTGA